MVSDDLLFYLFPTFTPLPHSPKSTRLNKIHISTRKSHLSERHLIPRWRNTLGRLLMETMYGSPVGFTILTNNIYSNTTPHMVVLFYLCLYIDKKNVKRGRGKGDIQQLRHYKHKREHRIGC